jgi:hypothetical protein
MMIRPLDIVVVALPQDRGRAEPILTSLVSHSIAGTYSTRLLTPDPTSPEAWGAAESDVRSANCVIFCWSRSTQHTHAAGYRALASETLLDGRALAVELEPGSRPDEQAGCTTYPLHGWRGQNTGPVAWLTGRVYTAHIAAAAREKVLGRDPPPPFATRELLRRRAWALLLGVGAVIGIPATLAGLWVDGGQIMESVQLTARTRANHLSIGRVVPDEALRGNESGGRFDWTISGIVLLGGNAPEFSGVRLFLAPEHEGNDANSGWKAVDITHALDSRMVGGAQSFRLSVTLPELDRVVFCLQRPPPGQSPRANGTSLPDRVDTTFEVIHGEPDGRSTFSQVSEPRVIHKAASPCGVK